MSVRDSLSAALRVASHIDYRLVIIITTQQQARLALMELMREAEVIDAETDQPIRGSLADTDQSRAFPQLLHNTDDLAALDKLDEVLVTK